MKVPWFYKLSRRLRNLENINIDLLVLCGLGAVLIWAFYRGLRKMV